MRILVVDDDELLAQTTASVLAKQQHVVDIALDGEAGWQFAIATSYDLVVLDVMLPKLDGVSLCQQLRQAGHQAPILLLTAKNSSNDKVMGLDAGADDYMVKPVNFDELLARIRALLRRGYTAPSILTWAALSLDPGSLEVMYDGYPLHLTATEHRLLELLLRNPQRVFSRSAIVEHLWTFDDQPEAATVKTYIKNLRQKLKAVGASTDLIETVYGLGYRLKSDSNCVDAEQPSCGSASSASAAEQSWREQQMLHAVARARDSFKTQIRDRLNVLQQAVETMKADTREVEAYQQAIYEAHRFAGALGTFGFAHASQLTEAIEAVLQSHPLNSTQVQRVQQLVHDLSKELGAFLTKPNSSAEINPDHSHLLVISEDSPWVQSLAQAAATQPIVVKSMSVSLGDEWEAKTLHLIQIEHPDVVLVDIKAASTVQVMALVTELSMRLSIPVLVITDRDDFAQRIEFARCGAYRFLLKITPPNSVLEQAIQSLHYIRTGEARILAVDSDRPTLEKIRDVLEPWGLQVKLLDEPRQFWETLVAFSPHLLVLGVDMPDLSGIDLCRVTRTDPIWNRLPILFLTVRNDAETIHQLFAIGADDCISKPIAGATLLTRTLNRLARVKEHQSKLPTHPRCA